MFKIFTLGGLCDHECNSVYASLDALSWLGFIPRRAVTLKDLPVLAYSGIYCRKGPKFFDLPFPPDTDISVFTENMKKMVLDIFSPFIENSNNCRFQFKELKGVQYNGGEVFEFDLAITFKDNIFPEIITFLERWKSHEKIDFAGGGITYLFR